MSILFQILFPHGLLQIPKYSAVQQVLVRPWVCLSHVPMSLSYSTSSSPRDLPSPPSILFHLLFSASSLFICSSHLHPFSWLGVHFGKSVLSLRREKMLRLFRKELQIPRTCLYGFITAYLGVNMCVLEDFLSIQVYVMGEKS